MKNISKKSKGFTLIELLVVIAIIGILTAIVTANFTSARARSRDAKRISDLAQIQLALELFFDRCNQYPTDITQANINTVYNNCPSGTTGIRLSTYISQIPNPPLSTDPAYASNYFINNTTSPTDYLLKVKLELNNNALQDSFISSFTGFNSAGTSVTFTCSTANLEYCVVPK